MKRKTRRYKKDEDQRKGKVKEEGIKEYKRLVEELLAEVRSNKKTTEM